jgi:formylglycine-generating enzyme required for sulfatase activity
MSGNVWEWTRSMWGDDYPKPSYTYPYNPKDTKRENLEAGDEVLRVLRGGSFGDSEINLRAAFRRGDFPFFRDGDVGFRVVSCRLRL